MIMKMSGGRSLPASWLLFGVPGKKWAGQSYLMIFASSGTGLSFHGSEFGSSRRLSWTGLANSDAWKR